MAKTAWGIEAGTSSVKAVQLTHDGKGNVTLNDFTIIQLSDYRVEGGDESMALSSALRRLVQEKEILPSDTCYVSLHGRNAFSRVVTLPPVSEDKIRETIANEARGQIPIRLEDAVWDYQRISGGAVGEIEVNLYAVKREVVNQLVSACKNAELPVRGIALAPLGIYNFVKYELDMIVSDACVCVDIGAENTDLLIIDGEKTWMRIIPDAGMQLTKAVMAKFKKLKPAQAEQLKRKVGRPQEVATMFKMDADQAEKICAQAIEAMKEPLKELVGEIYRSVGFYKGQNAEVLLNKLVMMGNGSKQHNIQKFFAQQLQYDVHRVDDLTSIMSARTLDPSEVKKNVQSLAVAMGLALQACEVSGLNTTNLIPQELIIEEKLERVRPMAIIGGAIVLVAGLLSFVLSAMNQPSVEESLNRLKDLNARVASNQSIVSEAIAKDQVIAGDVVSLNNARRTSAAVGIIDSLLRHSLAKLQNSQPDSSVILCDMPEQFASNIAADENLRQYGQFGHNVRVLDALLTNTPPETDEVPTEEVAFGDEPSFGDEESLPYTRTTTVLGTINYAAYIASLTYPQSIQTDSADLKGIANRLSSDVGRGFVVQVSELMELVLKGDDEFGSARERRLALEREFGNADLAAYVGQLRELMPKMTAREIQEARIVELTGMFQNMGELNSIDQLYSGKIEGGLRPDRIPTPPVRSGKKPIPVYAHFLLVVKVELQPFTVKKEVVDEDGEMIEE